MRLLIVTDAWRPQVNGVVRTLQSVISELEAEGWTIEVIAPDEFPSVACPTYPEIRLALTRWSRIGQRIEAAGADFIHIATEGPLGLAARRWCLARGCRFTTAYHTQFPDYLASRTRLPAGLFWRYIRWFHAPSETVMVSTDTLARDLASRGLERTSRWGRGVDLACFRPALDAHPALARLPRPILLYVGRVAVEKNLPAFLGCDVPGTKIVVGDGPAAAELSRRWPEALFLGPLHGAELASAYAGADVFVFPSRTDTFGLVMIEALACGTPVAALPVPGPQDIVTGEVGAMDEDLGKAISLAHSKSRIACADYGRGFSWSESARQFRNSLVPARSDRLMGLTSRTALSMTRQANSMATSTSMSINPRVTA